MKYSFLILIGLLSMDVATGEIVICYNYGCSTKAQITLSATDIEQVRRMFAQATDASSERRIVSEAIGQLYILAGKQTPIWRDKGENENDGSVDGQMDCIDHANTTTAFLRFIQAQGWFKFHQVLEPIKRMRLIFLEHWTARMVENETGEEYAVDTWYFDHGHPAAILRMKEWLKGVQPKSG